MKEYKFDAKKEILYIVDWIKKYFIENGNENTKAVIGISGGKDSTVAATLLVEALGPERVIGVLMPEGIQKDYIDAVRICEDLEIEYRSINIGNITKAFYDNLYRDQKENAPMQVMTNTPSRIRLAMLYAVAAECGSGRVCCTANRSEIYLGYSTKFGDAGDFALFTNYTASEVVEMGLALGLPNDLVKKAPSDGMCGRTDEHAFGFTYKELDNYLTRGISPEYEVLRKIETRHFRNSHKSSCLNLPSPKSSYWD